MNANDDKSSVENTYWRFVESERHFNNTQAGIRNLASTWMLAAFAAIALLLKSERNVSWLVSPVVLVGVVSLMATMGLLVLWINDQMVYQRLLDSGFLIALKLEYDDSQLPPIRAMMMYSAEGKGMSRWMTHFYTIPMWSFLAITTAATILRHSINPAGVVPSRGLSSQGSLVVLVLFCVAQLGATVWVQKKRVGVGARARATLFGDREFAAMFDGTAEASGRFAEMIRKYRPVR